MLERADLERALRASAPPVRGACGGDVNEDFARLMEAGRRMAGTGVQSASFDSLIGKEAADRIAAAHKRGGGGGTSRMGMMTPDGVIPFDCDTDSPLSRAELLELVNRSGKPSPTPGDAYTYGMLSTRLAASVGGDRKVVGDIITTLKVAQEEKPMMCDFLLSRLLAADGTTRGIGPRFEELLPRKGAAEGPRKKN
jgi:hypothetical protein